MKEAYDKVYEELPEYNRIKEDKFPYINSLLMSNSRRSKILDAGCGKGHYIRHLNTEGFDNVTGLEMSTVCCEKFLAPDKIPHINADIVTYAEHTERQYDIALCMDVLEHVPPEDLYKVIRALGWLAPYAIIGIANHPDIRNGVELHLIKENEEWWEHTLKQWYSEVEHIVSMYDGDFFIFQVRI